MSIETSSANRSPTDPISESTERVEFDFAGKPLVGDVVNREIVDLQGRPVTLLTVKRDSGSYRVPAADVQFLADRSGLAF